MNLNSYLVIATDLLKQADKEKILAEVVNIKTPNSPLPENFSIKILDHYGRIAVITYRGAEVLLLFKKMTSQLSNLNLEVAPRAYLKNVDDAWTAIKLVDVYTGVSVGERIKELETSSSQKDKMIEMLQLELEETNNLYNAAMGKIRKKDKTKIPPAVIQSSLEVNKYLAKIKPIKVQDFVRARFLWTQGFDTNLVHGKFPAPEIPVRYNKKTLHHLTKIYKMLKKAKLDKELSMYVERPPKVKTKKKVAKKKP